MVLILMVMLWWADLARATVNLVMPSSEVSQLLGVGGGGTPLSDLAAAWELAYVRDGVVNTNAAAFVIPVPENVNALQFVWWAGNEDQRIPDKVDYRILINVDQASDGEGTSGLYQPHLNISHSGRVPNIREAFRISLPCTGRKSGVVTVEIFLHFNFTSSSDRLQVKLVREKTCIADSGREHHSSNLVNSANEGHGGGSGGGEGRLSGEVQPHVVFYASLLSALAAMASTAICIVIVHVKGTFHKIIKSNGGAGSISNKNATFNTIVSHPTGNPQQQEGKISDNCYEPVFQQQQPLQQQVPFAFNEHGGLLTMDPRKGGPLPPPPMDPPPPPPLIGTQQVAKPFGFCDESFPVDAELRVTDWVNNAAAAAAVVTTSTADLTAAEESEEDELLVAQSIFQSLLIDRTRLKLGSLLQEGTYGRVYQGLLKSSKRQDDSESDYSCSGVEQNADFEEEDIMVKTVLTGTSQAQSQLLIQESVQLLWNRKSSLSNGRGQNTGKHILTPMGCTWDGSSPMVLYAHPSGHGNLKQYLTKFATGGLSTHQVVRLGVQMLGALAHLHKKKIVHKDVAARNCFMGDGQNLLLADSSLSRDLFPGDYHCLGDNENRPIKWMPIEAISVKSYSKASDVWSFGVFMWELMTKAQQPFGDIDPFEMESYLNEGYRLHQPLNCPDQLYSVLAACWATHPHERANVQSIHSTLVWMQKQLQQFV